MHKATLYHNPRCSKSRDALKLLQSQDIDFAIIEYLKTPPSREDYQRVYTKLPIDSAMQMIRPQEKEFKEAGLTKNASDEAILDALTKYPKLLERPIYELNEKAAIGRPLENIAEILA
ncbi:arsenate reductase (glutaredoxin) [Ningiella sp. W23]|uniref:arsenate reductase (glutaredoxin) n=1 Tax=Ningiella sp. W23 TaxID=3023715 RepID=UPI00375674BC